MTAFDVENFTVLVLFFPILVMKVFALADAIFRKDAFYVAAEKQNKAFWILILAISLVVQMLWQSPIALLNLLGTVAAGVYLADVRPTLRSMRQY